MAAGIYRITCNPTLDDYVGSCDDIAARWDEHRKSLRKGKHKNLLLQKLWNDHGEEYFDFELLEEQSDLTQLASRELHFLETLKPSLNREPQKVTTPKTKKITTTVRMSEDLFEHWKTVAHVLRRSQSDIVTSALTEYFEKYHLSSRYELHISGGRMSLLRFDDHSFEVVETREVNGLSPDSLVEAYRAKLNEPVVLYMKESRT